MFAVAAWNNGDRGYGLRVRRADREAFFRRPWRTVTVAIPHHGIVRANVTPSFWTTCPEIRSPAFGRLARSWPYGAPPSYGLVRTGRAAFRLVVHALRDRMDVG
jgi:hypothetical protein